MGLGISSKTLKILLLVKGIFILGSLLVFTKQLSFGEKSSIAQQPPPSNNPSTSSSTDTTPVKADPAEATNIAPQTSAKSNEKSDFNSFLDGILELPSLKPDDKASIGKYLTLAERAKQQVDDRMKVLANKGKELKDLEDLISEKLAKLDQEKKYIASTIQKEKEIQAERLDTLVALYEKMEPKKAGPMLEKMDKDLIVALFKRLKNKQVTQMLESMTPEKSVEITEYFGRIGSAREYDILKEINKSLQEAFDKCKGL